MQSAVRNSAARTPTPPSSPPFPTTTMASASPQRAIGPATGPSVSNLTDGMRNCSSSRLYQLNFPTTPHLPKRGSGAAAYRDAFSLHLSSSMFISSPLAGDPLTSTPDLRSSPNSAGMQVNIWQPLSATEITSYDLTSLRAKLTQANEIISSLTKSLQEARQKAAHYTFQHKLLTIESNEAFQRHQVEHDMAKREVEALRKDRHQQVPTSEATATAFTAGGYTSDANDLAELASVAKTYRKKLNRTKLALKDAKDEIIDLKAENDRLKRRIRENREHRNSFNYQNRYYRGLSGANEDDDTEGNEVDDTPSGPRYCDQDVLPSNIHSGPSHSGFRTSRAQQLRPSTPDRIGPNKSHSKASTIVGRETTPEDGLATLGHIASQVLSQGGLSSGAPTPTARTPGADPKTIPSTPVLQPHIPNSSAATDRTESTITVSIATTTDKATPSTSASTARKRQRPIEETPNTNYLYVSGSAATIASTNFDCTPQTGVTHQTPGNTNANSNRITLRSLLPTPSVQIQATQTPSPPTPNPNSILSESLPTTTPNINQPPSSAGRQLLESVSRRSHLQAHPSTALEDDDQSPIKKRRLETHIKSSSPPSSPALYTYRSPSLVISSHSRTPSPTPRTALTSSITHSYLPPPSSSPILPAHPQNASSQILPPHAMSEQEQAEFLSLARENTPTPSSPLRSSFSTGSGGAGGSTPALNKRTKGLGRGDSSKWNPRNKQKEDEGGDGEEREEEEAGGGGEARKGNGMSPSITGLQRRR